LNNGLAVYFEEQGKVVSLPARRETGKRVYIDSGYLDIIRAYGLRVHVPTWIEQG